MRPVKLLVVVALGFGAAVAAWAAAEGQPASPGGPSVAACTLNVEGMTCASCGIAVRAALKRLDGVKNARVSVPEKRAFVEYQPGKVTPRQMVDAVNKLGYRASLPPGSKGT